MPQKGQNGIRILKKKRMTSLVAHPDIAFRIAATNPQKFVDFKEKYGNIVQGIQRLMGFTEEQSKQYTTTVMGLLQEGYRFGDGFAELFLPGNLDYASKTNGLLQHVGDCLKLAKKLVETPEWQQIVEKGFTKESLEEALKSQGIPTSGTPYDAFVFSGIKALTLEVLSIVNNDSSGKPIMDSDVMSGLVVKLREAAKQNVDGLNKYIEDLEGLDIPIEETPPIIVPYLDKISTENRRAIKAVNTKLKGLDYYVAIAEADMLSLIDASVADGTPRYNTICKIKDGLEKLVAQGINLNTVRTLIGNDIQQQPVFFELLKENPKYVQGFDVMKSDGVSPGKYTRFLQEHAAKEIEEHAAKELALGGRKVTAFVYVMDIAMANEGSSKAVAKQLIETPMDWITYQHLNDFYQLALQQRVSVPIAESYLSYGAEKELNKQRIILDVAGLQVSKLEVNMILDYMSKIQDTELIAIANRNYEKGSGLLKALGEFEEKEWLDTFCEQYGKRGDTIRNAYFVLKEIGHGSELRELKGKHCNLIYRFARKILESQNSPHLPYLLGDNSLCRDLCDWLLNKPTQSIDDVLQGLQVPQDRIDRSYIYQVHKRLIR
jgi:hypothetical protein|tara:strand:+ start:8947 stop:10758 length:1812 start_codon:yes stop_codon:yes gene_type:complete